MTRSVFACVAVALVVSSPAPAATFTDVPAREIVVSAALPAVNAQDILGAPFGKPNGEVALLMQEDHRLKSRHSSDGGASWGSEVVISGVGQPESRDASATISADGKLYLTWIAVDPAGNTGIRFARSDDMGQSWTVPATLVGGADPTIGVTRIHIASGAAGQAAIIYRGNNDSDPYVVATIDFGAHWTAAKRIDAGVAAGSAPTQGERVALDSSGRIFAVFIQNRGSGDTVFYTRSTDGGTTFASELPMTLPAHQNSSKPDIHVASDGGVLVTFWDNEGSDHIYVMRSTNQGQTYSNVLNKLLANDNVTLIAGTAVDPATSTVFVGWVNTAHQLVVKRSPDSGATWGADQIVTTTAAGDPAKNDAFSLIGVTRTAAGTWVVAWSDQRADTYAGIQTDVYARSSNDGGVTFGIEQRADGGVAGAHRSWLAGIAATGGDSVYVSYQDGRDDNGKSLNFYGNRSVATPLSFGADARADVDDVPVSPEVLQTVATATDGASHVYAAFPAIATGPYTDVFVAASGDAGHTFGTPLRVGGTTAGARIAAFPELKAFSDGRVYLVYMSDTPSAGREIRFNRSTDFGATWQLSDMVLGTIPHIAGYVENYDRPGTTLEALSDGSVYVAWSDGSNVTLARSTDFGVNFSSADVDQDSRGFNRFPRICARGNLLVLVWQSPNVALTVQSIWGVVSSNKGQTWGTTKQLRTEGVANNVDLPALACDGSGHAVAVWPDGRNGGLQLFSSRFDGTNWSGDVADPAPGGFSILPDVAFSGSTAVVTYGDGFLNIYASRSTDDGATFPSFQQIDAAAPVPNAPSAVPRIVSDGAGNFWISWFDGSAGQAELAVRRSGDGGATYGSVYRLDRKLPQGGDAAGTFNVPYGAMSAAQPGVAFFAWGASRDSFYPAAIVNAFDVNDFDRDGAASGSDCNDNDPGVKAAPVETAALGLGKIAGAVRLAWTSQDAVAGTATLYDIVRGDLGALRSSGGFGAATCLAGNLADTPYDDPSAAPSPGAGIYYLVRARNSCGTGTYGNSSLVPDPRDALDAGSTCP